MLESHSEETSMQSIDEIAKAITSLDPAERKALMERLAQADQQDGSERKVLAIADAMNDELFLADLREVMNDFTQVDAEETVR